MWDFERDGPEDWSAVHVPLTQRPRRHVCGGDGDQFVCLTERDTEEAEEEQQLKDEKRTTTKHRHRGEEHEGEWVLQDATLEKVKR